MGDEELAARALGPMGSVSWRRGLLLGAGWILVVLASAAQWYAYDASRTYASPFSYYVWWSCYMWALLTPAAVWLGWRIPIRADALGRTLALHVVASVGLTVAALSLESYLGWLRHQHGLSPLEALRHYFSQHAQISLGMYWLLVGAVMFIRSREDAKEASIRAATLRAQLAGARLEVLRRQLQPHFLFNTLQASIALIHDDPVRAEDVLLRLSELLRVVLQDVQTEEIALGRELDLLRHYMAIQECRFGDRLRFEVQIDPALLDCGVPALVLQPLVENAVLHGVGAHRARDTITIRGRRSGDTLDLVVENCSSTLAGSEPARGLGLAMTRERLVELYGRDRSSLELRPLVPRGVSAVISIPVHRMPKPAGHAQGQVA